MESVDARIHAERTPAHQRNPNALDVRFATREERSNVEPNDEPEGGQSEEDPGDFQALADIRESRV